MTDIELIERRLQELTGTFDLRPTIEKAAAIGDLLIEARSLVRHGEWAPWLASLGLHRRTAWDYIAVAKAKDEIVWPATQLTIKGFVRYIRTAKHAQRESERADAREEARRVRGSLPEDMVLAHADCRKFAWPKQIDLAVCDPPWSNLDDYRWIASWAAEHLREGGLALIQCGQYRLPEVMAILGARLNYVWTMSIAFNENSGTAAKWNFRSCWKPVLVYVNGTGGVPGAMNDTYQMHISGTEKTLHPWQQPIAPWRYWLSRLTTPGDKIADPFAGSATIGEVCHELSLAYFGTESDEQTYRVALGRLKIATRQKLASV